MPEPTPTADQIVTVAEITLLPTSTVTAMVAADADEDISNAKWARTLADIELWPDVRDETGDLKKVGSIEFFEGTGVTTRLGFRNMLRSRYGQTLLTSETFSRTASTTAVVVPVGSDW